jgi:hypothetical protein
MKITYVILTAVLLTSSMALAQTDPEAKSKLDGLEKTFDPKAEVPDPNRPEVPVKGAYITSHIGPKDSDSVNALEKEDKLILISLQHRFYGVQRSDEIMNIASTLEANYKEAYNSKNNRNHHFKPFSEMSLKLLSSAKTPEEKALVAQYMISIGKAMVAEGIQHDTLFTSEEILAGFDKYSTDANSRKLNDMDMKSYALLVKKLDAGPSTLAVAREHNKDFLRGGLIANGWSVADANQKIDESFASEHMCFTLPSAVNAQASGNADSN